MMIRSIRIDNSKLSAERVAKRSKNVSIYDFIRVSKGWMVYQMEKK